MTRKYLLESPNPVRVINPYRFGGGDPYFASVGLLLHCDGSDTSTSFPDSSSNAHTVTANGNAQVDTGQSKFGGASAQFDGTGDYLSVPHAASITIGTAAFTIECWVRVSGSATFNDTLISKGTGAFAAGDWTLYVDNSNGDFVFRYSIGSSMTSSGTAVNDNTWQHIAVTRDESAAMKMWVDGTEVASVGLYASAFDTTDALYIGGLGAGAGDFTGHIDDVRITLGVARYTASFTPPTEAFPDS